MTEPGNTEPQPPYGELPPPPYQPPAYDAPQAPPPPGYASYGAQPVPGAPPYGAVPGAGYGMKVPGQVDPVTGLIYSDKEKTTAGLLQLLLSLFGLPGVGRLYAGHTSLGLVQLLGAIVGYVLICVIVGIFVAAGMIIWGIIDGIIMLTSATATDGQGRLLR